jgi:hypothetical protein
MDQNEKNLINADVSCIKKQIDYSLNFIDDYMAWEVNVNETINKKLIEYQSSDVVVIIARAIYPLKIWVLALINPNTSGSCILVQFQVSED